VFQCSLIFTFPMPLLVSIVADIRIAGNCFLFVEDYEERGHKYPALQKLSCILAPEWSFYLQWHKYAALQKPSCILAPEWGIRSCRHADSGLVVFYLWKTTRSEGSEGRLRRAGKKIIYIH
jgi:hypothetical protein